MNENDMSFWDHIEALRGALFKAAIAATTCAVAAFCFKEKVFAIILAPRNADFVTYRLLNSVTRWLVPETTSGKSDFAVRLIASGLTEQFMVHMRVAVCIGLLAASPYLVYLLFHFVAPALYANERRYAFKCVCGGYVLFLLGVALSYFVIFPFTFRFLGTYQVSDEIENLIVLQSYTGTLLTLCVVMGLVFELPILCALLGRMGLLTASTMKRRRKHAIVVILIVSAIITPTSDVFTLMLVALPIWLLYEVSARIMPSANADNKA